MTMASVSRLGWWEKGGNFFCRIRPKATAAEAVVQCPFCTMVFDVSVGCVDQGVGWDRDLRDGEGWKWRRRHRQGFVLCFSALLLSALVWILMMLKDRRTDVDAQLELLQRPMALYMHLHPSRSFSVAFSRQ